MRKLTSKATSYLYEKSKREERVTLQKMAMKMEEQTMVKRAMNNEEVDNKADETAQNAIRDTIGKAMDLSKILNKNS